MATIDVRDEVEEVVDTIVFAETHGSTAGENDVPLAYCLTHDKGTVIIRDTMEYVLVNDKERALHLIKALNKAIELGWLK